MEVSVTNVPFALEADSPQKLSALMLQNNLKHSTRFLYHITVKGKMFQAWYYLDASILGSLTRELNKKAE